MRIITTEFNCIPASAAVLICYFLNCLSFSGNSLYLLDPVAATATVFVCSVNEERLALEPTMKPKPARKQ